jgi:hypothetical protein
MTTEIETTQAPPRPIQLDSDESPSLGALAGALAKAQGAMKGAKKDSENPHFKSKYADLASIWEACRAALAANGLAVMQRVRTDSAGVIITTMLVHSSGEWVKDRCLYPLAQRTIQSVGSVITYGRRYSLAALVGVAADEDDDGNGAMGFVPENSGQRSAPVQASARTSKTSQVKEKLQAREASTSRLIFGPHKGSAIASLTDSQLSGALDLAASKRDEEMTDAQRASLHLNVGDIEAELQRRQRKPA